MANEKIVWLLILVGTTFFVSRSKFAKGVVRSIRDHVQARRQKALEDALRDLHHHARLVKAKKKRYVVLLLRREDRNALQQKNHETSVKAARNERDNERIQSKKSWDILERYGALPVDPRTDKPWGSFDDFLERVDEPEEIYA